MGGLTERKFNKFLGTIKTHEQNDSDKRGLSFACWFDIIAQIHESDGLAAFHNPLIGLLLRRPMRKIHEERAAFVRSVMNPHVERLLQLRANSICNKKQAAEEKSAEAKPVSVTTPREESAMRPNLT